jgi:peptidoglycan/xylan/chitin deacetylase (PgdA/CDA1 family)
MTGLEKRKLLAVALYASGAVHVWGWVTKLLRMGGPVFLTGHRVVPPEAADPVDRMALLSGHAITPAELERRLKFMQRWVMPAGLPGDLKAGMPRQRCYYLTFDDGYRDNVEHAGPVLQRLGVQAVIFAVADLIANPSAQPWWDRWGAEALGQHADVAAAVRAYNQRCGAAKAVFTGLGEEDLRPGSARRYLDASEIAALPAVFHVANHTKSHANLSCLDPDAQIEHVAAGERALAQHPRYLPLLAFPFGISNDSLLAMLRTKAKGTLAFATGGGSDSDPHRVRRKNLNLPLFPLFAAQAVGLMR